MLILSIVQLTNVGSHINKNHKTGSQLMMLVTTVARGDIE